MMRTSQIGLSLLTLTLLCACDPKDKPEAGKEKTVEPSVKPAGTASDPEKAEGADKSAGSGAAAKSEGAFEGVIDIKIEAPKSEGNMGLSLRVKGTNLRMDLKGDAAKSSGGAYVLVDLSKKDFVSVAPSQKLAMRMDFGKLKEQAGAFLPADQKDKAPPKFEKLGSTQTIAGRTCDDWRATQATGASQTLCMSRVGASWFRFPTDQLPLDQEFAAEMFDGAHFPLKVESKDPKAGTTTMVVTAMDEKPVPDSDFAVPAGYQIMDMSNLLGGLAGIGGPQGLGGPQGQGGPAGATPSLSPEAAAMLEKIKAQAAAAQKANAPPAQ